MTSTTWAIISLLGLVAIIFIANWKNINVGIVGLGMAMLIATLAGLKLRDVYSNFNLQIYIRMLSMQVMIVIARTNGTLNILGNAVLKLCKGKRVRILPIVLFFTIGIGSWFNLGLGSVLTPLTFAMAYEMGFKDPFKLAFVTFFTTVAWGVSPYTMMGLNTASYADTYGGYTMNLWSAALNTLLPGLVLFVGLYIFHGWYKMEPIELKPRGDGDAKINSKQIFTLLGFAAFVIANLGFGVDMMVAPIWDRAPAATTQLSWQCACETIRK